MWVLVSVWACLCLTVELLGLLRPHRRQLSLVAFLLTWNLRQRPQSCHFISHVEKLQLLVFSVMGLGLSFMNMNMNFIWCRFFHIRTEQKDKRTGEQCPAWMEIIFPQFLFKISLKFPTHLPVDVVLKTDGVRRGTIDWQLQNKTWTGRLKKKEKKKGLVNQSETAFFRPIIPLLMVVNASCEEDRRPTDDGPSQQCNAEGDSQWDGLNAALFGGTAVVARHSGEHVRQASKRKKKKKNTGQPRSSSLNLDLNISPQTCNQAAEFLLQNWKMWKFKTNRRTAGCRLNSYTFTDRFQSGVSGFAG